MSSVDPGVLPKEEDFVAPKVGGERLHRGPEGTYDFYGYESTLPECVRSAIMLARGMTDEERLDFIKEKGSFC